jgi:hypothetical protein
MAEDDKDHTISSSSSESESLAHLVLGEVGESMSSDDEGDKGVVKEVDMMVLLIGLMDSQDRRGVSSRRSPGLFIYYIGVGQGEVAMNNIRLSDPPVDQTSPKPSNRNLLNLYASSPHSPLRISHQFSPALLQHDPIPLYRFQRRWHRDARTFPVANLIVVISTPCKQVPPAPTRSCTCMRFE